MAVTEEAPIASSVANGVTTVFPHSFTVLDDGDLVVTGTVSNVTTTYTLGVDYSVFGVGSSSGSVTFFVAPANGTIVTRYRNIALERETDYQDNGDLLADVLNADMDRLWFALQDIFNGGKVVPTCVRAPNGESLIALPAAASRAGYYLGFDGAGQPTLLAASTGTAAALAADLVNSSDAIKGARLVAYNAALPYASGLGQFLNYTFGRTAGEIAAGVTPTAYYYPPGDARRYGVVADGTTNDAAAVKRAFDVAAQGGLRELVFPSGTIKLLNANNDSAFTCAVVISGLKNIKVRGQLGTKFTVGSGGGGSSEFGFFRVEQCENVAFEGFELDGSGITITGTGANRSNGIICVNFNVNSAATDLAVLNKNLEFRRLYIHDIGGGITIARRSQTLAATADTIGLIVENCRFKNLQGVDHGVSMPHTRNALIRGNWLYNEIETKTIQDNMAFDASSGAEDILIENNYVRGFVFGAKCETSVNVGPASNETRSSKRIKFVNNTFDEIGDPTVLVWPGPSGGDTFGIKLNGQDCVAEDNTIRKRTVGVTTGGLGLGIAVVNTHNADSNCRVVGNRISGAQYDILHNDTTPTTRECSVTIRDNRCDDAALYGILAQANAVVENNTILRAGTSAIICQSPNNSFFRRNIAIDCATANNGTTGTRVVFYQEGSGSHSGIQEWTDNVILDSRGASAAQHGYYLQGGTTRTNALIFRPGYQSGLLTAVTFDRYFSIIGESMQIEGTTARPPVTFRSSAVPSSTAPWSTLPWLVGDRAIREVQAVGQPKAWVCTTAGTPGTWTSEGNL